jgi:hypothetical protein
MPEDCRILTGFMSGKFTAWNGLTLHSIMSADQTGIVKYFWPNINNLIVWPAHCEAIHELSFLPNNDHSATAGDNSICVHMVLCEDLWGMYPYWPWMGHEVCWMASEWAFSCRAARLISLSSGISSSSCPQDLLHHDMLPVTAGMGGTLEYYLVLLVLVRQSQGLLLWARVGLWYWQNQ